MRNKTKWYTFLLMIMALALILGGCSEASSNMDSKGNGGTNSATTGATEQMSVSENKAVTATEGAAASSAEAPSAVGGSADGGSVGEIAAEGTGTGLNQKLIYKANLTIEAVDYDKAATALRNAIHQASGYILQFQDGQYNGEKSSTYTIKVPAAGFMDFIDRLDGIEHKKFERQISGTDVTEEYVDLQSRLKAQQVVEQRLLAFMDKATKADDLVKFSEQLATVQENIERLKGRIRYLDNNVSYSTIELRLYQPEAGADTKSVEDGLGGKMSQALNDSVDAMVTVLQGLLIFVAGALPILLLVAIIGLPIYWLRGRHRSKQSFRAHVKPPIAPTAKEDGQEEDPDQPKG
ncbi:DUF4349 domain-containing protein [Paenibacillus glycanilyticus]|uniref:DUF4349 domain-containing protein n=1 Tax=Paenibacillus glycanilyticus TaxID=126569 RepID=A0ABQ6GBB0_9BACL|nr:DUF4349 domain-containing protein [Paenibacillus glycanilyticus]GLX68254.1 hypothetical protein MU1_25990 [Paenibacillus glycanilyticus]